MRGLTIATNYRGEALASPDYFSDPHHVMTATVPMQQVRKIYSIVGDLFAWLCIAGFAALIARALSSVQGC